MQRGSTRARAHGSVVRAFLFVTCLLAAAASASAQQAATDATLRRLLEPELRAHVEAYGAVRPDLRPEAQPLGGSIALDTDAAGQTRVGVFIEIRSPAVLQQLHDLGVEVGSVIDNIVTARVPLAVLPALLELPIERVHAARVLRLVHDSSMVAIGADRVRYRDGAAWQGITGAGAIVGVVDTGLDILHPDFHDDNGVTRVLALWDHLSFGTPAPGFGYGLYCTRARIQLVVTGTDPGACPTQDINGHGTHVAGSAAGDGSAGATPFRYAGVAPEAELLIVRAGDGRFSENRIADGLVWIREEARSRGRPVVVNLSLGHQGGPHDGSSFLERIIDELSGPGFIVVLAAGNSGENRNVTPPPARLPSLIHARVQPAAGATATIAFVISPYEPHANRCDGNQVQLSAWYDVRDRIEITVVRPNGSQLTVPAGARGIDDNADGRIEILNAFPLDAYPGTAEGLIVINGCAPSGVPAAGTWQIRMRAQPVGVLTGVPVDVYLHTVILGSGGTAVGTTGFDNRFVVSSPATSLRGIAVGAFATRTCWPSRSAAATTCYTARPQIGDLAPFSSGGPTRDGRMKPEIVAPGMGIMSALSQRTGAPPLRVSPDGMHWVLEGTSMAAPHVAGAVALMLQHRPSLTPEDVRDVLARSGRQDAFTTRTYDASADARPRDWWGYGKLDVPAALELLLDGGAIASLTVEPAHDTIPQGGSVALTATAADAAGEFVFVDVTWTSLDPTIASVTAAGLVRGLQPGTARIVATAAGLADTAVVVVQPPAVLVANAQSATPAEPVLGQRGALLPLLVVGLEARGPEAVQVDSLAFEVSGADPAATLLVLEPLPGAPVDTTARVVGRSTVELLPEGRVVMIPLDTFLVPRNSTRELVLVVELSGGAPTGAAFSARLLPERTRTVNVNSRLRDRVTVGNVVAAERATTTVLRPGEAFALSENPVRGESVVFNFAVRPTVASVFTATGSRVADLLPRFDALSYRWDLTNDDGARIVPGVYLLVFQVADRLIRERLLVLSPRASEDQ
jgi:subtilisin family serine protease